jgi:hypothetical protein
MRPSEAGTPLEKGEKVKCPSVPNRGTLGHHEGHPPSRSVPQHPQGISTRWSRRGTLGHFFLFFSKKRKKEQGQREHGVEIAARGNKEDSSVPVSFDEELVKECAGHRRMNLDGKDIRVDRQTKPARKRETPVSSNLCTGAPNARGYHRQSALRSRRIGRLALSQMEDL